MLFPTPIFLFAFLPILLFLYYLSPRALKNAVLLTASLIFYAWGEVFYVAVMLVSILANYQFGKLIGRASFNAKRYLVIAVAFNILLLGTYKYAAFIVGNVNVLLGALGLASLNVPNLHLPLGISFFTFQAISYIVDIYRKEVEVQKSLSKVALYICLFPQLIAGPIVRYKDVAEQLKNREHNVDLFYSGAVRFIQGLAKKLLIANPLGEVADGVFDLSQSDMTSPLAWVGITCYALQIFFDFSAYSDMAIGLGRMFGFRFLENFNFPYIATSIKDFWRRWHISLSGWFRDYLYIPIGGSRRGKWRTYLNLYVVFFLTGLWHGAGWNFIVWGLLHGSVLVLENGWWGKVLDRLWSPVKHFYTLVVVLVAWVFFRAENMDASLGYLDVMFFGWVKTDPYIWHQIYSAEAMLALVFGCILSTPVSQYISNYVNTGVGAIRVPLKGVFGLLTLGLLFLCAVKLASTSYNPFIYFRF